MEGAIGPAAAAYLTNELANAAARGAALVILRMDTPGGLDTSMREIIQGILSSPVPVATYVSPSGARAASAGTYILYASHVSAMTPGTNLGAATPVQISAPGLPGSSEPSDPEDAKSGAAPKDEAEEAAPVPKSAMERKAVNDAVAYIRSLAQMRGRNAEWAEKAVREAASLSADDALAEHVIDVLATSTTDLLSKIDGRTVQVNGADVILKTRDLELVPIDPDWQTDLLGAITNPNIALILMMIGVYGLIFEFMNPGTVLPGTVGAICLIVGLYALAALPVNYAGAGLLLLGLVLMIAEAFVPSFGALGIGGILSFILGAAILIDTDSPSFAISWAVVVGTGAGALAFSLLVVRMAFISHRRRVITGREQMIGDVAVVQDWRETSGHVFIHGERWRAVGLAHLTPGQNARVISIDGLTLRVEPEASAKT
ncbi:MAG: nodulation protein NfeD [Caldilineaceae bacterium]|nr:nodulation protein NfeD [Caldilineaceae bacterium]